MQTRVKKRRERVGWTKACGQAQSANAVAILVCLGIPWPCYRCHSGPKWQKESEMSSRGLSAPGALKVNESKANIFQPFLIVFRLHFGLLGPPVPRGSGNGLFLPPWAPSGPVLRDTARLSQRYPPIARYGVFGVSIWPIGCDTLSPFSKRFPLGEHAKWRCEKPPPPPPPTKRVSQRYLRDTTWKQGKWVRHPSLRYYPEKVLRDKGGGDLASGC